MMMANDSVKQQWMLVALLVLATVLLVAPTSAAAFQFVDREQDLARRFRAAASATRDPIDVATYGASAGPNGWWRPAPRPPRPQRPSMSHRPLPVTVEPWASALDIERLEVNELHRERTIPNIIQCIKDFVAIITGSQTEFSAKCCVVDIFGALCRNKPPNGDLPTPEAPASPTTSTTGKPAAVSTSTAAPAANGTSSGANTTPGSLPKKTSTSRRVTRRPPSKS